MRKIKWLSGILAVGLILGACGGSKEESKGGDTGEQSVKWKFGHLADENHIWHKTAVEFADTVKEKTDGQVEIQIYPNNSLGGEVDTINAIQSGTADMVISGESMQNWAPKATMMAVPYAFRDLDHVKNVVEGELGAEIEEEIVEKVQLTPLYYHTRAPRNLTSNEPIKTPADLKGFSMRVPNVPLFLKVWEAAGAKPQVMDFNEVFTGLQQGVIDGQENPVDLIQSSGLNEVQDYLTLWNYSYDPLVLGMNKKLYDSMSDEDQELFTKLGKEAAPLC